MATADDVRGILIAGDAPDANGPQVHQDKLGEYIRTDGTGDRPAYFKDNKCVLPVCPCLLITDVEHASVLSTNHMLWFADGPVDGPTW